MLTGPRRPGFHLILGFSSDSFGRCVISPCVPASGRDERWTTTPSLPPQQRSYGPKLTASFVLSSLQADDGACRSSMCGSPGQQAMIPFGAWDSSQIDALVLRPEVAKLWGVPGNQRPVARHLRGNGQRTDSVSPTRHASQCSCGQQRACGLFDKSRRRTSNVSQEMLP
jgi:hypothetical protein